MTSEIRSPAAAFLKKRDSWLREIVGDDGLSHATVRVGVHVAMRMDGRKQSGAWPSIATIARDTNVSTRAVISAIDELCGLDRKSGEWTKRRYLTAERKRNVGNRYWLNFWWE